MKIKLAIVSTHPIQYYSPWFRFLAEGQKAGRGGGIADCGLGIGGPPSLLTSRTREELRRVENETSPVRHERPTRFVYGRKKEK